MKIKYVSEDDLNLIKTNLSDVLKKVVVGRECSISDLFANEHLIKDSSMAFEEFQLDMSQPVGKESLTDVENIQRVYNHLKFLSDSQASDERVWAAYTFSELIDYMRYRWPASKVQDLNNRYLFGYSPQRSLFRNGISRLWWIGRFTYDASRTDPYELTRFLCSDQDYIENICGRNIFNNPQIGKAVIAALYDSAKAGSEVNRDVVRGVAKYINLLSGTYLLDAWDYTEVYGKVVSRLKQE